MRQQLAEEAANPKQSYVPEANQKAKLKVKWSKSSDSPYNRYYTP